MNRKTSVFSVPVDTPFNAQGWLLGDPDPETGERPVIPGYKRATAAHLPIPAAGGLPARHVIHAAARMPILAVAIAVGVDGRNAKWNINQLKNAKPGEAPYLLEREYEVAGPAGAVRLRQKMAEALPAGATVIAEWLSPGDWTDEEG